MRNSVLDDNSACVLTLTLLNPSIQLARQYKWAPSWQRQCNHRQWDGSQQGFELHSTRLSPNLSQFGRIFDPLRSVAQLARTSRGQADSSLIAPLKEARRRAPKQEQKRQSPPTACTARKEYG
jgi:hypothetical protein